MEKRAGDETRTRDINLGKVALYQLSYTRLRVCEIMPQPRIESISFHNKFSTLLSIPLTREALGISVLKHRT